MDAFDADVLIYAAAVGHPLGGGVRALLLDGDASGVGPPRHVGSVVLLPELLSKPMSEGRDDEVAELVRLLARVELIGVDEAVAALSVDLGARYQLRAADAIHLATAVAMGADRFITNNRRDFSTGIEEVGITYPDDLMG